MWQNWPPITLTTVAGQIRDMSSGSTASNFWPSWNCSSSDEGAETYARPTKIHEELFRLLVKLPEQKYLLERRWQWKLFSRSFSVLNILVCFDQCACLVVASYFVQIRSRVQLGQTIRPDESDSKWNEQRSVHRASKSAEDKHQSSVPSEFIGSNLLHCHNRFSTDHQSKGR